MFQLVNVFVVLFANTKHLLSIFVHNFFRDSQKFNPQTKNLQYKIKRKSKRKTNIVIGGITASLT